MAKNMKSLQHDEKMTDTVVRRGGFRAGDAVLVVLAILLVAVLILLASTVLPAIRENFREYEEELLFTVEIPMQSENTGALPEAGDAWVLLDSGGAVCTVRAVEYVEEAAVCRVTLLRRNTIYREGEGYHIAGTRIAVGSTLYFRRDPEYYFAALVTGLDSERFALPAETTDSEETRDPEEAITPEETAPENIEMPETAENGEEGSYA